MKILDTFTALLDVITVVLIYVENWLFFANNNKSNIQCTILRVGIMICSAIVIIGIIMHYNYKISVIKYRENRVEESVTLYSTGLWKYLLIELAINAMICPPSIDYTFEMKSVGNPLIYSLDGLTSFFSLFRTYTVLRLFEHYSHWTNERSRRVCKINGA